MYDIVTRHAAPVLLMQGGQSFGHTRHSQAGPDGPEAARNGSFNESQIKNCVRLLNQNQPKNT